MMHAPSSAAIPAPLPNSRAYPCKNYGINWFGVSWCPCSCLRHRCCFNRMNCFIYSPYGRLAEL